MARRRRKSRSSRSSRRSARGSSSRRNRSHARSLRVRARRKQKRLKLKYSRHGYKNARRHGRKVRGKWRTVKKYRRKAHNPKRDGSPTRGERKAQNQRNRATTLGGKSSSAAAAFDAFERAADRYMHTDSAKDKQAAAHAARAAIKAGIAPSRLSDLPEIMGAEGARLWGNKW